MLDLLVIFALLVVNGVFAMAEIAIVSARRARMQARADGGDDRARLALELASNPERFLSTVQIGISLVGVFAGAFGGARLSASLEPVVASLPGLASYAHAISFAVVVGFITYLSLVIGELAPKGLALRNAEGIACAMARPMDRLARAARPLVWFLERSTRVVLALFGRPRGADDGSPVEEVEVLLRQGIVTGAVEPAESDMVEGVLDLRERLAVEIMRPKPRVTFLAADASTADVVSAVASSSQRVFPVRGATRDEIVGMVSVRDLYQSSVGGAKPLRELARPALFVAENQPALSLLGALRRDPLGAALVTDEFGTVRGLITLDDLVEEVVGELRPGTSSAGTIRRAEGPSWIVDGRVEVDRLSREIVGIGRVLESEQEPYQSLAGFIVHHLDRLPVEGESFTVGDFAFEVVDMDRQRIDKVAIRKAGEAQLTDPREVAEG